MTEPLSQDLRNLTSLERELLWRVEALDQRHAKQLTQQDQKIASLEAEIRAEKAAVIRLTHLLTCFLGPEDQDAF